VERERVGPEPLAPQPIADRSGQLPAYVGADRDPARTRDHPARCLPQTSGAAGHDDHATGKAPLVERGERRFGPHAVHRRSASHGVDAAAPTPSVPVPAIAGRFVRDTVVSEAADATAVRILPPNTRSSTNSHRRWTRNE